MRNFHILALGLAVLFHIIHPGGCEDASALGSLNGEEFKTLLKEESNVLVEFFAPWCGHCKNLQPHLEKAAETLRGSLRVVQIDADEPSNADLLQEFGVAGFPTIIFLSKTEEGQFTRKPYEGERTHDVLVKWAQKQLNPLLSIDNDEALSAWNDESSLRVLLYFENEAPVSHLKEAALKVEDAVFALVKTQDLARKALGQQVGSSVAAVLRPFDEPAVFEGEDWTKFSAFVAKSALPLVGEITQATFLSYRRLGLPIVICTAEYDAESQKPASDVLNTLSAIAKQFDGRAAVGYNDAAQFGQWVKQLGAKGETFPTLVLLVGDLPRKWIYEDEIAETNIAAWLQSALDGTLASTIKSEPVPEQNNGPVTVLVGTTFNHIVLDESRDVLVEFYASWCGHCKSLEPTYNQLGEWARTYNGLTIAKIEATLNDQDHVQISGFPTLVLFTKANEQIPFNGERTLEGLQEFLKERGSFTPKAEKDKDEL